MAARSEMEELSLGSIRPEGWIRTALKNQSTGISGKIAVAGFPFDTKGWADEQVEHEGGTPWWPYEQTGYWVDGALRCGYLLGDKRLVSRVRKQVDYVLEHQDSDGYLGPRHLREEDPETPGANRRWAHAVFFRALMAAESATGDRGLAEAVARHFLGDSYSYSDHRDIANVEAMLWAYGRTGKRDLLRRALSAYKEYNRRYRDGDTALRGMRSDRSPTEHGVTYNELAKLPAIIYLHTGKRRYLRAAENAYGKLDRDHMLVDGVPSSAEHFIGKDPLASHETCDIADYTWSVGYLLMATGDAEYADKIERAVFNAAFGAVRPDFRALQYFSCPNQLVATNSSNHNRYFRGSSWMSFRPRPGTQCCTGAVNRILPNFAARMWMSDAGDGLVATCYGPSRVTAKVGAKNAEVTVTEKTDYPFSDRIDFQFDTNRASVRFPLWLRIPGWCTLPQLLVNEVQEEADLVPGEFVKLDRVFKDGDRITLVLPMDLTLTKWPDGGIAVERGPLVYSLEVQEKWTVDRSDKHASSEMPAWNVTPVGSWNYALCVNESSLADAAEIRETKPGKNPWSAEEAPVRITLPARRVRKWKLQKARETIREEPGKEPFTIRGSFTFTPPLPKPGELPELLEKREQQVTLIPYGCTNLRLTIFPQCPDSSTPQEP